MEQQTCVEELWTVTDQTDETPKIAKRRRSVLHAVFKPSYLMTFLTV